MSKKIIISQEDWDVFLKANSGTRPLKDKKRVALTPQKKSPIKRPALPDDAYELSEKEALTTLTSDDEIQYKQESVSHEVLRKLRKGQYNVDAILDLHGFTIEAAGATLLQFLKQCSQKEARVALIIHGKGANNPYPILKNKLNHWLRNMPVVLAFCSASPRYGGKGAMTVLLKENKFG